jgi:hypothetical protein
MSAAFPSASTASVFAVISTPNPEASMFDANPTFGAHSHVHGHAAQAGAQGRKPVEYRLYYAVVFSVALPIALIGRLFPREPGYLERRAPRSILGEARALTNTVIPYVFMG